MKSVLILLVSGFVVYTKALECSISGISNDHFKKVVTECVKDNQTLYKILDLSLSISAEDDSSASSDKEVPVTKGVGSLLNTKNVKFTKYGRTKRSRNSKSFNSESPMLNMQKKYMTSTTTEESTTTEGQSEENTAINNIGESDDVCILQCLFEKLGVTDSDGLPDHKKFAAALLKTSTVREIRDFLQESTDECFQQMEQEDSANPCEYSTKLITCLADKGKQNCEDWPTENLPF